MYVQLDADYYDHPKTLHLVSLIGPEADVYPPRLWTWAMKYAKKGVLRSNSMLEVACRWRGEPGKLATAMMAAGFVDMDGLTIHGWMERTGHDLEVYEQKKERFRERRRNFPGTFRERSRTVTEQFPEHSALTDLSGADLNVSDLNGTKLNGAEAPPAPPLSEPKPPASSPEGLLVTLALKAKVIYANERQLRTYIAGWLADKGFQFCEELFMSGKVNGKDLFWIHDTFFKAQKNGKSAPGARKKVINKSCPKCNGTGRRLNPVTNAPMDCGCVREVAV